MAEDRKYMFKIIDNRTRETIVSRICARSHTDAEEQAKALLSNEVRFSAAMLRPGQSNEEKITKRTKKR
jgi:transposase